MAKTVPLRVAAAGQRRGRLAAVHADDQAAGTAAHRSGAFWRGCARRGAHRCHQGAGSAACPIDAIAGTSMGAVVGGLYASGLSGEEIEHAMASVNWQSAFRDRSVAYRARLSPQGGRPGIPGQSAPGVAGETADHTQGPGSGAAADRDAQAADLAGRTDHRFRSFPDTVSAQSRPTSRPERRSNRDGDLTTAMRASMSVPGVFAPVEYRNGTAGRWRAGRQPAGGCRARDGRRHTDCG